MLFEVKGYNDTPCMFLTASLFINPYRAVLDSAAAANSLLEHFLSQSDLDTPFHQRRLHYNAKDLYKCKYDNRSKK